MFVIRINKIVHITIGIIQTILKNIIFVVSTAWKAIGFIKTPLQVNISKIMNKAISPMSITVAAIAA